MNVDKYDLDAGEDFMTFEFVSEGSKGSIWKRIEFQPFRDTFIFNLAFGDKDIITSDINDLAVTNNGDTEKVLRTVAEAVYIFLSMHPAAYVYASGSTLSRTRLYRIGITKFYEEIKNDFYLYGQDGFRFSVFELGKEYDGFLVQRKFY